MRYATSRSRLCGRSSLYRASFTRLGVRCGLRADGDRLCAGERSKLESRGSEFGATRRWPVLNAELLRANADAAISATHVSERALELARRRTRTWYRVARWFVVSHS